MGEIVLEKQDAVVERDYGTNCLNCERYKRVGEVCVLEHGKTHLWDYCRDFEARVELPEYHELMRSVKQDMSLQRQKERERKERERKQKQKERKVRKELKRRERISRARRRYLARVKKEKGKKRKSLEKPLLSKTPALAPLLVPVKKRIAPTKHAPILRPKKGAKIAEGLKVRQPKPLNLAPAAEISITSRPRSKQPAKASTRPEAAEQSIPLAPESGQAEVKRNKLFKANAAAAKTPPKAFAKKSRQKDPSASSSGEEEQLRTGHPSNVRDYSASNFISAFEKPARRKKST